MIGSLKSRARTVGAVGTGLVIAGAVAMPLQAQAHEGHAAPAKTAVATAVTSTNGQMVVRDAATGELRAATPEEASTLQGSRASSLRRSVAPPTQAKEHNSGARGARLTDEFMSYSVVVRQADGTLAALCFSSKEEADAALKAASAVQVTKLPTE